MRWSDPNWRKNLHSVVSHTAFGMWMSLALVNHVPAILLLLGTTFFGFLWEVGLQKMLFSGATTYASQALAYPLGTIVVFLFKWLV